MGLPIRHLKNEKIIDTKEAWKQSQNLHLSDLLAH